jgi:hypothetical protein
MSFINHMLTPPAATGVPHQSNYPNPLKWAVTGKGYDEISVTLHNAKNT